MPVTRTCQHCGAAFTADSRKVERGRAKFCSKTCADARKRKGSMRVCRICQTQFYARPSQGDRPFCSIACRHRRYELPDAVEAKRQRGGRICLTCGKSFHVPPSSTGHYCSTVCRGVGRRNGETRICRVCQQPFYVKAQSVSLGGEHGQHCSKSCRAVEQRKPPTLKECVGCAAIFEIQDNAADRAQRFCVLACARAYANPSGPELKVRGWLNGWGVSFEVQSRFERWFADLYVPSLNLIIEVNGCYYHSCVECGLTSPNPDVKAKDQRKLTWLRAHGHAVLVVWEHDFKTGEAERLIREAVGML